MSHVDTCFACDRPMKTTRHLIDTRDGQTAYVGADCFKKVKAAGEAGYGGKNWKPGMVRMYMMPDKECPTCGGPVCSYGEW